MKTESWVLVGAILFYVFTCSTARAVLVDREERPDQPVLLLIRESSPEGPHSSPQPLPPVRRPGLDHDRANIIDGPTPFSAVCACKMLSTPLGTRSW